MPRSTMDRSARTNRNNVLEAIANGATYEQAARHADVQVSTVARYMQDPDFLLELQMRRSTIATTTAAALTGRCLQAIQKLQALMEDPRSTQTTQAKAAATILAEARAWRDTHIEERITQLEEQARKGNLRAVR